MASAKSNDTETKLPGFVDNTGDAGALPSFLKPKKTIQIAVSGGVFITEPEREIIDTPDFQRLRYIRQLGLANLVYPTALHTRFDHSLGTLEMVQRMVDAIRFNAHSKPEERKITSRQIALARIYALVHDVAHIPMGHSIEDELGLLQRHDKNTERTERFLGKKSAIGKIILKHFDEEFLKRLHALYKWEGTGNELPADEVFIHDLVSNTVCADLLDYLKRDNFFCNLGISLEYHFLNYLYLRRDKRGHLRLFVRLWKDDESGGKPRRDILSDLCRLLEARYLIAERVYFHHAKIIPSAMLGRSMQEAQISGEIDEALLWEMSDDVLVAALRQSKNPIAAKLATEVAERRLYKEEAAFSWADIEKPQSQSHLTDQLGSAFARVGNKDERRKFEDEVADIIGANAGDVLIYAPTQKMNRKEAEMNVFWKGKPTLFKDIDDEIVAPRLNATLTAHGLLWSIRLLVRRSLSAAQRHLAKELCELELATEADEREDKKRKLFTRIVEDSLATQNRRIPEKAATFRETVSATVEELLVPSHKEGDTFTRRLKSLIDKKFPTA